MHHEDKMSERSQPSNEREALSMLQQCDGLQSPTPSAPSAGGVAMPPPCPALHSKSPNSVMIDHKTITHPLDAKHVTIPQAVRASISLDGEDVRVVGFNFDATIRHDHPDDDDDGESSRDARMAELWYTATELKRIHGDCVKEITNMNPTKHHEARTLATKSKQKQSGAHDTNDRRSNHAAPRGLESFGRRREMETRKQRKDCIDAVLNEQSMHLQERTKRDATALADASRKFSDGARQSAHYMGRKDAQDADYAHHRRQQSKQQSEETGEGQQVTTRSKPRQVRRARKPRLSPNRTRSRRRLPSRRANEERDEDKSVDETSDHSSCCSSDVGSDDTTADQTVSSDDASASEASMVSTTKQQVRVSFGSHVRVRKIPPLSTYTAQQRTDMWYNGKEMRAMRQQRSIMAQQLKQNKYIDDLSRGLIMRGSENIFSSRAKKRHEMRDRACDVVFAEQDRQYQAYAEQKRADVEQGLDDDGGRSEFQYDFDRIAKLYEKLSFPCVKLGIHRGIADERDSIVDYKEWIENDASSQSENN